MPQWGHVWSRPPAGPLRGSALQRWALRDRSTALQRRRSVKCCPGTARAFWCCAPDPMKAGLIQRTTGEGPSASTSGDDGGKASGHIIWPRAWPLCLPIAPVQWSAGTGGRRGVGGPDILVGNRRVSGFGRLGDPRAHRGPGKCKTPPALRSPAPSLSTDGGIQRRTARLAAFFWICGTRGKEAASTTGGVQAEPPRRTPQPTPMVSNTPQPAWAPAAPGTFFWPLRQNPNPPRFPPSVVINNGKKKRERFYPQTGVSSKCSE